MTTTTPTTALADLDLDLDELRALCDAVKRPWYGTLQIADGVTDDDAVAFIEAFSPDTVSDLIALARRAAQPVAPVQQNGKREGFEAAAKALQERAAGHYRNGDDELQDECLQCASMLHDMKPALAAPSPQVADIAELPPLPTFMRSHIERAIREADKPSGMSVHDGMARLNASYLKRIYELAIAASRRASPLPEPTKEMLAAGWECMPREGEKYSDMNYVYYIYKAMIAASCRAAGGEVAPWTIEYMPGSISILDEKGEYLASGERQEMEAIVAAHNATPTPASAGQAAPDSDLRDAAEALLEVLDGYHEQLVPINRKSVTVNWLRKALAAQPVALEAASRRAAGGMSIEIKHAPAGKTDFARGEILGYEGSPTRFMVVGEDDLYLHTFILGTGMYWGVRKEEPNLACLVRYSAAQPAEGAGQAGQDAITQVRSVWVKPGETLATGWHDVEANSKEVEHAHQHPDAYEVRTLYTAPTERAAAPPAQSSAQLEAAATDRETIRQQAVEEACHAEIADLRAQLASAQKDAARYRWLMDQVPCNIADIFEGGTIGEVDELIDDEIAARAQRTNITGQ